MIDHRQESIGAGAIAGFVAGLAATYAMNRAQAAWSRAVGFQSQSAAGSEDARDWQERADGENANELIPQAIATRILGRRLDEDELEVAAQALHYAFGSICGAVYGAIAEVQPGARRLAGSGYGLTVWLAADEIGVPLLGFSKRGGEYPPELHLQSFASHVVFGVTTEVVRRMVRAAL